MKCDDCEDPAYCLKVLKTCLNLSFKQVDDFMQVAADEIELAEPEYKQSKKTDKQANELLKQFLNF